MDVVAFVLPDQANVIAPAADAVGCHRLGPAIAGSVIAPEATTQLAVAQGQRAEARIDRRDILDALRMVAGHFFESESVAIFRLPGGQVGPADHNLCRETVKTGVDEAHQPILGLE